MIIDGEDGSGKRQPEPPTSPAQLHISSPLLAAGPSYAQPPPNYHAAVSSPATPLPSHYSVPQPHLSHEQQTLLTKLVTRESTDRRFIRAFAVAVLVWILLASLTKSILDFSQWHYYIGVPTKPSSADGRVLSCYGHKSNAQWHSSDVPMPADQSSLPKYISQLRLELPTDAAHYLMTAGSLAFGRVWIVTEQSDNLSNVTVVIQARYYNKSSFKDSDVCLLERDGGARGIGIYTPTYAFGKFPADRQLEYRIEYRIPVSRYSSHWPTNIRSFQSDMSNFWHAVEPLQRSVSFDQFEIKGSNSAIAVESLTASCALLRTSNANIVVNTISSNDTVTAVTTNANVEIHDAQMTSTDTFRPAAVVAYTTNGRIGLASQLAWKPRWPESERSPRGALSIKAEASNGRLDIAVHRAPVNSKIGIFGRTSNSPAQLLMFPTFEGDVRLRSTNTRRPVVAVADDLGYSHPVYGSRRRYTAIERSGGGNANAKEVEWRGQLAWGAYESEPTPSWWGTVDVQTSNGQCAVRVPCASASCMMTSPVILLQNQTRTEQPLTTSDAAESGG